MNMNFFDGLTPRIDESSTFISRRKELIAAIKKQFSHVSHGKVVLFANFESLSDRFRQDKTFFYYTGMNEPGAVLIIDLDGTATIYVPNYLKKRSQWMNMPQSLMCGDAKSLYVDCVQFLGNECEGYTLSPYFSESDYTYMIQELRTIVARNGSIFTMLPQKAYDYSSHRSTLEHLQRFIPGIMESISDISSIVSAARRRKDMSEIEKMHYAIEITQLAHESAIQAITAGTLESEVQASLEYMMIAAHARPAFASIVASGKNSTILHYHDNNGTLKNGDVIVIDIGAEYQNYCADLTRTYPVSGVFSKRQKEVYNIVLQTQEYIASLAKPGIWLKNKDKVDQSLHHLAIQFLQKKGYDIYFTHGIGHYLGLDVHDVGDYSIPLQEGDVITIEPGIYISQEGIGIRIEDNYWITKNGAVCLSENLPKEIDEVERSVQKALDKKNDNEDEEFEDEDDWMNED